MNIKDKKTKIVCSIGPASAQYDVMKKMIENGMSIGRINCSHATLEEKVEAVELIRKLNKDLGTDVKILFDTKGPDLRTNEFVGELKLVAGNSIRIDKSEELGTEERISINYKDVVSSLVVGDKVLLDDGLLTLEVVSTDEEGATCNIINGGKIISRRGVAIPGKKLNMPFISEQDKEDIIYACKQNADYLAASFVGSKEDVIAIREILKEQNNTTMKIMSKIESKAAMKNLDEIIEVSDAIMVARGDLGVEIPVYEVPLAQKLIVKKCNEAGKFCVVATEMMESMKKNSRPTRAEISDVANAVLDGGNAVMLSGESTIGKYPAETVKFMAETCLYIEQNA